MRVFVTGASGWIGSAVVPELIGAGHQVVGLARSDASAASIAAAGAEVHRGSLEDLESLRDAAAAADGIIHLAFKQDEAFLGDFQGAADADTRAIETFGEALADSDRPLIIATGTGLLPPGRVVTEQDQGDPNGPAGARVLGEQTALSLARRGVRSVSVRLPPTNHGEGDNGFMTTLVAIAREYGESGYVGDGMNRWPAVHRLDSARLFRLALEHAPPGSVLHGVAEEGVPMRRVAEVIGRHLDVPAVSISLEEAIDRYGFLGAFLAADLPASSAHTRERMGWQPTHPGLIEDLEAGHYFQELTGRPLSGGSMVLLRK